MKKFKFWLFWSLGILLCVSIPLIQPWLRPGIAAIAPGQNVPAPTQAPQSLQQQERDRPLSTQRSTSLMASVRRGSSASSQTPFNDVIRGLEKRSGLFTIYRDAETGKAYLELQPGQLNQNFLFAATLESAIGDLGLISGWPINYFLFQFRQVQDTVQFLVPNIYFQVSSTDPQQRSVERSFSDSVLATLPIESIHPERESILIDLNALLLGDTDLPGLAQSFPWIIGSNYTINSEASYLNSAKAFPLNIEIESVYGLSGDGEDTLPLETVPDSRSFNLSVRYSISQLPQNNQYHPRLADERIGYFVTAYQNLSAPVQQDPFVRYIHRWNLEKQNSAAPLSPPKEPIVFWIENAVPDEYREAIREGALSWNRAFENIGFQNAIEVRQMPDDATWDPADARYNTIRWSNSFQWGAAIGPSRINPLTGQILDADIVIDANMLRFVREQHDVFTQASQMAAESSQLGRVAPLLCNQSVGMPYQRWMQTQLGGSDRPQPYMQPFDSRAIPLLYNHHLCFGMETANQAAFGALSLALVDRVLPSSDDMQTYINQYLRYLIAHEVGHTLGLRHNFRGSTLLAPEDLNNSALTQTQGLVSSVMDYIPLNLAPEGIDQGDYFPTRIGPYDEWAIAYGYTSIDALDPRAELRELQAIAQRSPDPQLAYGTDEDSFDLLAPDTNAFDLSSDMLKFSQWQMDNSLAIWERLDQLYPLPGEGYSELRDRFNIVFGHYFNNALTPTRYIGGQRFNRNYRDDPGARPPFEPIPLDKQREALSVIERYVFSGDAFQFSPTLINRLAPSRWMHWGSFPAIFRLDYPVYDNILFLQSIVLSDVLSSERLARLRDAEFRAASAEETMTLSELFNTLQTSVWTELFNPDREADSLDISTLRRGLQRQHLNILVNMVLQRPDALESASDFLDFIVTIQTMNPPEDARVIARYQLQELHGAIASTLRRHGRGLDQITKAHLEEARDRIEKVLDAPVG